MSPEILIDLRSAALPAAVGAFLTGTGLVAAGVALALWRDRQRAPLWFALFTITRWTGLDSGFEDDLTVIVLGVDGSAGTSAQAHLLD